MGALVYSVFRSIGETKYSIRTYRNGGIFFSLEVVNDFDQKMLKMSLFAVHYTRGYNLDFLERKHFLARVLNYSHQTTPDGRIKYITFVMFWREKSQFQSDFRPAEIIRVAIFCGTRCICVVIAISPRRNCRRLWERSPGF